jgi:hypothetical protein
MRPVVTQDTNINVTKAMVIEALNARFPDLQIPITAGLSTYGTPSVGGDSVDGFNISWTDRSGGEI